MHGERGYIKDLQKSTSHYISPSPVVYNPFELWLSSLYSAYVSLCSSVSVSLSFCLSNSKIQKYLKNNWNGQNVLPANNKNPVRRVTIQIQAGKLSPSLFPLVFPTFFHKSTQSFTNWMTFYIKSVIISEESRATHLIDCLKDN